RSAVSGQRSGEAAIVDQGGGQRAYDRPAGDPNDGEQGPGKLPADKGYDHKSLSVLFEAMRHQRSQRTKRHIETSDAVLCFAAGSFQTFCELVPPHCGLPQHCMSIELENK
ncbi:MAG: hypothetical protein RR720_16735, partial [Comamonas sp.]